MSIKWISTLILIMLKCSDALKQFHTLFSRTRFLLFFHSSVWCLDTQTQGKTSHRCCYWPLLILLFLILLLLFYIYIYFEVLHSGQHSSPLLKHRLMLLLHFKIESAGTKTPNSTLIPSERNRQRLHLTAGLANGTNLELWFHERLKLLVNYWWIFNICRQK